MKKKVFVLALAMASSIVSANDLESIGLCTNGYTVFFGNGIRTEATAAYASTRRTSSLLGTEYDGEPVTYKTSYNPTDGTLGDLLEAFAQKRAEDPTLSWQLFFRWVSGRVVSSSLAIALRDYFGNDGADRIRDTSARLAQSTSYNDPTVSRHAANYLSELLAGKRVMVVAHSQGNLYANATWNALARNSSSAFDMDAFGIAAIATPANGVATGDGYVTSDSDLVIDAVRIVSPLTLPANNDSVPSFPPEDRLGHDYNRIYIGSYANLSNQAINVMTSTLSRLSTVNTTGAAGPITATLTWNQPADLDLHTFEPAGGHVYYANPTGSNGFLDRDDIGGVGPEHYYTSCENFEEGTYRFGINYFSGEGSKVGTIKMSVLGVDYPSRSMVFTTPEDSQGNSNPSILFRVNVTKNEDGVYQATVN